MLIADYFREQADALYSLAKGTPRAAERLELVLEAMEFEARAVDAERGKIAPPYVVQASVFRDRKNAYKPPRLTNRHRGGRPSRSNEPLVGSAQH